ncbi:MAG: universal stress protein, partial [Waterburya sp.]
SHCSTAVKTEGAVLSGFPTSLYAPSRVAVPPRFKKTRFPCSRIIYMIVLGSHGHGAVYRTLVGSVSEGIIHKASCPVLIVPAKKF